LVSHQQIVFRRDIRQRLVLILGKESRLVLQPEIHGMLNRRCLVLVVAFRPRHDGTFVHQFPVLLVEGCGFGQPLFLPQTLCSDLSILLPQLLVGRERIDHLRPLALPLRMLVAVQNPVGHILRSDDRAGHDA
jgi:hypothetical protein